MHMSEAYTRRATQTRVSVLIIAALSRRVRVALHANQTIAADIYGRASGMGLDAGLCPSAV